MNDLTTNLFQIKVKDFLNLIETCVVVLHSKWLYKQCWLGSVADGTKVWIIWSNFFFWTGPPRPQIVFFFPEKRSPCLIILKYKTIIWQQWFAMHSYFNFNHPLFLNNHNTAYPEEHIYGYDIFHWLKWWIVV